MQLEFGKTPCESDIVRASFIGSTQVGRILMQQCAPQPQSLPELGGNAPVLVFDDAKLEQAVQASWQVNIM